jgi:hypothetical protein
VAGSSTSEVTSFCFVLIHGAATLIHSCIENKLWKKQTEVLETEGRYGNYFLLDAVAPCNLVEAYWSFVVPCGT